MSSIAISTPAVVVNNVSVGIVGNTVKFTEGMGESKQRVESAGGGSINMVYSEDVSTMISTVNFSVYPTPANLDTIKNWKANANANAISFTGVNKLTGEEFSRFFSTAALTANYEVPLGADTVVELVFMSAPAV